MLELYSIVEVRCGRRVIVARILGRQAGGLSECCTGMQLLPTGFQRPDCWGHGFLLAFGCVDVALEVIERAVSPCLVAAAGKIKML